MQGVQPRDPRAVENPITAIFDLAEDVEAQAPKVRKLLRYVRVFVYVWLFLAAVLMVLFPNLAGFPPNHLGRLLLLLLLYGVLLMHTSTSNRLLSRVLFALSLLFAIFLGLAFLTVNIVLGVILIGLFYLGMIILDLIRDTRSFLDYYALRYRVVRAVREADPVVHVPPGDSPVQRLLAMLAQRSPSIGEMIRRGMARVPAMLTGQSGVAYRFDAALQWPAGQLAPLGIGPAGAAVYVKSFDRAPTPQDLDAVRRAVEDVSLGMGTPPSRVIALWRYEGANLPDATYAYLTSMVVKVRLRGRDHAVSMELVTEMPDGTYDFIPIIMEAAPVSPTGTAAPART